MQWVKWAKWPAGCVVVIWALYQFGHEMTDWVRGLVDPRPGSSFVYKGDDAAQATAALQSLSRKYGVNGWRVLDTGELWSMDRILRPHLERERTGPFGDAVLRAMNGTGGIWDFWPRERGRFLLSKGSSDIRLAVVAGPEHSILIVGAAGVGTGAAVVLNGIEGGAEPFERVGDGVYRRQIINARLRAPTVAPGALWPGQVLKLAPAVIVNTSVLKLDLADPDMVAMFQRDHSALRADAGAGIGVLALPPAPPVPPVAPSGGAAGDVPGLRAAAPAKSSAPVQSREQLEAEAKRVYAECIEQVKSDYRKSAQDTDDRNRTSFAAASCHNAFYNALNVAKNAVSEEVPVKRPSEKEQLARQEQLEAAARRDYDACIAKTHERLPVTPGAHEQLNARERAERECRLDFSRAMAAARLTGTR